MRSFTLILLIGIATLTAHAGETVRTRDGKIYFNAEFSSADDNGVVIMQGPYHDGVKIPWSFFSPEQREEFQKLARDAERVRRRRERERNPIQAEELAAAYDDNEVMVDSKLKGHRIVVFGEILKIGKDGSGLPYVAFHSLSSTVTTVVCLFAESDSEQLASIHSGQMLEVSGVLKGKDGNAVLNECRIVPRPMN